MPKAKGGEQYHATPSTGSTKELVPSYAKLGLDKKTAMVAQQLAALPEETRQQIAGRETTLPLEGHAEGDGHEGRLQGARRFRRLPEGIAGKDSRQLPLPPPGQRHAGPAR